MSFFRILVFRTKSLKRIKSSLELKLHLIKLFQPKTAAFVDVVVAAAVAAVIDVAVAAVVVPTVVFVEIFSPPQIY